MKKIQSFQRVWNRAIMSEPPPGCIALLSKFPLQELYACLVQVLDMLHALWQSLLKGIHDL